jgi:ABC-type thiamin/hydroxymethylpyrimidine transport system permease subunit
MLYRYAVVLKIIEMPCINIILSSNDYYLVSGNITNLPQFQVTRTHSGSTMYMSMYKLQIICDNVICIIIEHTHNGSAAHSIDYNFVRFFIQFPSVRALGSIIAYCLLLQRLVSVYRIQRCRNKVDLV